MEQEIALEISGLDYFYRHQWTGRLTQALFDLNINIHAGECFGFLGHNGAGKTTTIKCILGLVRPKRGNIKILGRDFREPGSRSLVGYLPEQPYFYDHLTVQEILELYGRLNGLHGAGLLNAVESAVTRVKLTGRMNAPMRTLSKGLTQRVALAQSILANPKLLILDEPFSGLDPIGRKEFRDILTEMKAAGCTIFLCSHILSDVEFLCQRVSIMAQGRLRGIYDLKNAPEFSGGNYELVVRTVDSGILEKFSQLGGACERQAKFTVIRFTSRPKADAGLKAAVELGVMVDSFEFAHPNLEDLFVQLVQFEEGGK